MSDLTLKNLDDPDEIVSFPLLRADVVEVGGLTVARTVHQPGWRWSTHVRPEVGGEWCRARHLGIQLSGRMKVVLRSGTEIESGPGDVVEIPPEHDAWVVGDEPVVQLEWAGFRAFAGEGGRAALVTLLFTDIVESTPTAARLGDVAWREVLANHYQATRAELDRAGGREVKTTGDGVLAVFEAPAAAIRCAARIRDAAIRHDLHIRVGLHVGEVQLVADNVEGIAVHEAARIMAAAEPDEVLVSETTRMFAPELSFEDRGVRALKGLPGERRLFALAER